MNAYMVFTINTKTINHHRNRN